MTHPLSARGLEALCIVAVLAGCGPTHGGDSTPTYDPNAVPTGASAEVTTTCGQIADFELRCRPDASCTTEALRSVCLRYRPDVVAALGRCIASADCSNGGSTSCPEAQRLASTPSAAFTAATQAICQRCPAIGASGTTLPTIDECIASAARSSSALGTLRTFNDATLSALAQCATNASGDATTCAGSVATCLQTAVPEFTAISRCPR